MKFILHFFSLLAVVLLVAAIPNPIPGSSDVTLRDPAVFYNLDTQKYLVFSTGGGIRVYESRSITGPWNQTGVVLPGGCSVIDLPGRCEIWAPDVNLVNGTYTLYYSVSKGGSQHSAIGVAQSSSMEIGSWTDLGEVVRSNGDKNFNCIDPNLVVDNNGLHFTFGSYWDGIFQIPLSDVKTPATDPPGTHLAGNSGRPAEGGFVYKSPDSKYYFMLFSDGTTPLGGDKSRPAPGKEYKVRVGRSESAQGPFVDKDGNALTDKRDPPTGSLLLGSHDDVYAPGGQSVFRDPVSNHDVMIYHYVKLSDPVGGPSYLGLNYLDFSSGWPEILDITPVQPSSTTPPSPTATPSQSGSTCKRNTMRWRPRSGRW